MFSFLDSYATALSLNAIIIDIEQLERALAEVSSGKSVRETAKQFHISKDYLRRRIKGTITRKEFNAARQSLPPF